jgi:putative ABC transport system ATP-binding protein
MSIGYALSGSSPKPAVRLVPTNRICFAFDAGTAAGAPGLDSGRRAAEDVSVGLSFAGDAPQATTATSAIAALNDRASRRLAHDRIRMLVARELSKEYRSGENRLAVLRDVSFSIPQGAFVAIVGPSGSGKTTLLGLLAGLDTPSHGQVLLDGADLTAMTEDDRARLRGEKVGFVFQSFQLISTLTALENVQVPLELRGESGAGERATELLRRVGLGDRLDHFPTQLSGGEQQRVAIARAFANAPRIMFADEPTGNLDSDTGARIVELLEALNRESKTTIILVTHDLALASRTQRVIRLSDGRVISDTETERAA